MNVHSKHSSTSEVTNINKNNKINLLVLRNCYYKNISLRRNDGMCESLAVFQSTVCSQCADRSFRRIIFSCLYHCLSICLSFCLLIFVFDTRFIMRRPTMDRSLFYNDFPNSFGASFTFCTLYYVFSSHLSTWYCQDRV